MNRAIIISDLKFAIGEKESEISSVYNASLDSFKMEKENKDEWIKNICDAYYRYLPIRWIPPHFCHIRFISIHHLSNPFLNLLLLLFLHPLSVLIISLCFLFNSFFHQILTSLSRILFFSSFDSYVYLDFEFLLDRSNVH